MRISDWSSDVCSSDLIDRRITNIGMFVEIPRKQDLRPNRHRKAPEIRQYLALDANALDPWRIGFARDGRDLFGERQGHRRPCSRIEPDIHGLAIGIARKHRSDDTLIAGRNPDDVERKSLG